MLRPHITLAREEGAMASRKAAGGKRHGMVRTAALVLLAGAAALALLGGASVAHGKGGGVRLGSKEFAPNGQGFGRIKPATIFNGGDPNGLVTKIKWKGWGKSSARGHGKGAGFKPGGGYYSKPVIVHLRAYKLGHCGKSHKRAYKKLQVQFEKKPNSGKFGKWGDWAGSKTICKIKY